MLTTKGNNTFDSIVLGDNWAGWSLALALSKQNQTVALIGPQSSSSSPPHLNWPEELEFYPHTELTHDSLQWLSSLIDEEVPSNCLIDTEPTTWEKGRWIPFMGFGETQSLSVEYLSHWNVRSAMDMVQPISLWKQKVINQFTGTYLTQSELTGLEYQGNQVTAIILNGSQKLKAQTYIYCGSPKHLLKFLPEDLITTRLRQKISKAKTMTGVRLTLEHNQTPQSNSRIHFFPGSKGHEPFVGRFLSSPQPDRQISIWQSLMPDDMAEDVETTGSQLRYIKRQLKRPFPNLFHQLSGEKIVIEPESHGYIELNTQITSLDNLWQSSPLTQKTDGVIGNLAAAKSLHKQIQASL